MTRLRPGTTVPSFQGVTTRGTEVTDGSLRGRPVLLQFHRYATCPACFLSVHEFTRRFGELRDEGLDLVAFFYSPPEELAEAFRELAPDFEIVGDPDRTIYDRFGVERSHWKLLDPRTMIAVGAGWSKGAQFSPISSFVNEDTAGVPADFLVDAEGVLRHVHYGRHTADSMRVDEVLQRHRALGLATSSD